MNNHVHPIFGALFDLMYQPATENASKAVQEGYDAAAECASDVIYSANGWPFPARPDPAIEECEHDWMLIHDYEGDPSVINGTHSFSYLECRTCGEQCNDEKIIQGYEDSAAYDDYLDWDN